jgi:hypothetical protein
MKILSSCEKSALGIASIRAAPQCLSQGAEAAHSLQVLINSRTVF